MPREPWRADTRASSSRRATVAPLTQGMTEAHQPQQKSGFTDSRKRATRLYRAPTQPGVSPYLQGPWLRKTPFLLGICLTMAPAVLPCPLPDPTDLGSGFPRCRNWQAARKENPLDFPYVTGSFSSWPGEDVNGTKALRWL